MTTLAQTVLDARGWSRLGRSRKHSRRTWPLAGAPQASGFCLLTCRPGWRSLLHAICQSLTAPHAQPCFSWRPRVLKAAASALQHATGLLFPPTRFDYSAALHPSIDTLPPLWAFAAEAVQCSLLHTQKIITPTSRPWYGMVEARRSVTAGHGMVTVGHPVLGHGRSRLRR
jgi:hypothetical protein